jgi:hypothetical protein
MVAQYEEQLDTYRASYSLRQVLNQEDPDEESVDNLLSNFNVQRRTGTKATGNVAIYTSRPTPTTIREGTRFSAGNGIEVETLQGFVGYFGTAPGLDSSVLAYVPMRQLAENLYVFTIEAVTVDPLESALAAGQALASTINSNNITRIETASTFVGGSAPETTLQLLERSAQSVSARVVTGRDNICSLLNENVNGDGSGVPVLSCAVQGFGDDLMLRDIADNNGVFRGGGGAVDIYAKTAQIPITVRSSLPAVRTAGVWRMDLPRESFPGAYGVLQVLYEGAIIPASGFQTILSFEQTDDSPLMSAPIHARYSPYQLLSVEFTFIDDPIVDDTADFDLDVLYMPGLLSLQSWLQDPEVRSYSFDTLVKAPVPIVCSFDVEIRYNAGLVAPAVVDLQQTVADTVNLKEVGSGPFQLSDIVYALRAAFQDSEVQMPVQSYHRIWLPDGTTLDGTSITSIQPPPGVEGVSNANVAYFCFPQNVNITLTPE